MSTGTTALRARPVGRARDRARDGRVLDLVEEHHLLARLDVRADPDGEVGEASRRSSGVTARDDTACSTRAPCASGYSPQSKSRERPQRPSSSAAPSTVSSSPGHGSGWLGSGAADAFERLLEAGLLLGLEERVVLERILDRVPVERHVAVERGVALLQVEVLLDRAGERGRVVLARSRRS